MTVRVVSYNILVPIYADNPEYYPNCQPQFLKTDHRWNLIQTQLEQEIVEHKNTVICIQELCLNLLPKLELFFRRLDYSFFHTLYGQRRNDYMGVGIAIPVSMKLNSISRIKIGDHIRSMSKLRTNEDDLCQSGMILYDPWEIAMDRANTLICLHIMIDDKPLCIGTYHMPCLYDIPNVMAIHSLIVKDLMFELAGGQNFILAGDFNIKPSDVCYRALIQKDYITDNLPESSTYEISYRPNKKQILKSAYREKNGTEPVYTNFCDTLSSPNFVLHLIISFLNGHLTVEQVLELPDHPISKSYPDETHPSDHLMIAATFRFL